MTSASTTFPNKSRVAVLISVFFETYLSSMPQPNPVPPPPPGIAGRYLLADSWADFGHKVGMPRLLNLLKEYKLPATFGVNGVSAERHPELMRRVVAEGHELIGHAYSQDVRNISLSESEERAEIQRSVEALERTSGVRPVGWISPGFGASANTARLLAEEGFVWHGDYMDQELPYVLEFGGKRLVAVPYVNDTNDVRLVVRNANPPSVYHDSFRSILEWYYRRKSTELIVLSLTVHAHVFGRGDCIPALAQTFHYIAQHPNVWVARRGDLARWCLDGA